MKCTEVGGGGGAKPVMHNWVCSLGWLQMANILLCEQEDETETVLSAMVPEVKRGDTVARVAMYVCVLCLCLCLCVCVCVCVRDFVGLYLT